MLLEEHHSMMLYPLEESNISFSPLKMGYHVRLLFPMGTNDGGVFQGSSQVGKGRVGIDGCFLCFCF